MLMSVEKYGIKYSIYVILDPPDGEEVVLPYQL
jgi:hypothetical protein